MMREPISKQLRYSVFERDGFTCRYCGRSAPDVVLHADHKLPAAKGGKSTFWNLVTACSACNGGKGSWLPLKFYPCQRETAIAAEIFEFVYVRDWVPPDRMGSTWWAINQICLGSDQTELFPQIVRDSTNWLEAHEAILRCAQWTEEDISSELVLFHDLDVI